MSPLRMNKAQLQALHRVYLRDTSVAASFLAFRRTCKPALGLGCFMIYWKGMWLGIEPDGYTHS